METTLYLKHESGAVHAYSGRRYAKLKAEILAGRGGDITANLVMNGYIGYVDSTGEVECFEGLNEHFSKQQPQ